MKKLVSLVLALMLSLSVAYASDLVVTTGAEQAATLSKHTVPGLYSVSYDATAFSLDNQSFLDENNDDYTWLFMLTGDEYEFDADMTKLEGYDGLSLFSATDEQKSAYLQDTLDALSDYEASLATTVEAIAGNVTIPFYVYSCVNDEGPYLLAETVAQGYALDFYTYYLDGDRAVDDALQQSLRDLLLTFEPAQ